MRKNCNFHVRSFHNAGIYHSALVTLLDNNRKYKSLLFEKIER